MLCTKFDKKKTENFSTFDVRWRVTWSFCMLHFNLNFVRDILSGNKSRCFPFYYNDLIFFESKRTSFWINCQLKLLGYFEWLMSKTFKWLWRKLHHMISSPPKKKMVAKNCREMTQIPSFILFYPSLKQLLISWFHQESLKRFIVRNILKAKPFLTK